MTSSIERRRTELTNLRNSNPAQIIALYRGAYSLPVDGQLPYGISFTSMIEAILANEQAAADGSQAAPSIAK